MKTVLLKTFGIITLLLLFNSCEKAFIEPNAETDALSIFDEYAKLVKEKYAMLDFKNVSIDALTLTARATITNSSTEEETFAAMSRITLALRDGHSSLAVDKNNPEGLNATFDFIEGYPEAFNIEILASNYIGKTINSDIKTLERGAQGVRAAWGPITIQNKEIGYVWIPSWNDAITDAEIEQIFSDLKSTKGLIFDIRQNTGGDPALATKFASYFMTSKTHTGLERFKTGPGANSFSDSKSNVAPSGSENMYTKKVAVLTDRFVYSASTTFLYSLYPLDNVITIGQKSGGGSGAVADGFLANGWYWSLSTSEFIGVNGEHFDDGVEPDINVDFDVTDTSKDEIIERAILELQ